MPRNAHEKNRHPSREAEEHVGDPPHPDSANASGERIQERNKRKEHMEKENTDNPNEQLESD